MDDTRFVTIDSFPTCSKQTRFLYYYAIKSTRVTVVSFGSCFILIYVKNKVTKRCILPEDVTCGTIIKVPDLKGDAKFLLCGTDGGSVFAIRLPSSKQDLITLKNETDGSRSSASHTRMNNSDYVSVYKYRNLEICAISCIDSNILIIGPDDTGLIRLIMLQPVLLSTALKAFKDGGQDENMDIASPYEEIPIEIPTIRTENASQLKLVVLKTKETQSSPYNHSLDNVLHIKQALMETIFEIQEEIVACFFLPNGEVWFRTLGYGTLPMQSVQLLTHLQEECVGVTAVLLDETQESFKGERRESAGQLTPAMILFGANQNMFILGDGMDKKEKNSRNVLPYTAELKALILDWNGIMPIHQAFINQQPKGFNVTSGILSFFGEQCLAIQRSDEVWTFQDFESHTSLVSINPSSISPSAPKNDEISETQINDLIGELKMAEMQTNEANKKSMKITKIIKQMSALATYLIDNPICEGIVASTRFRKLELLSFVPSCLTVDSGSKRQVNITVKVTNCNNISILEPFICQLQAVIKCSQFPRSQLYTFDLEDLKSGAVKHLCMSIDRADMPTNKVTMTIFLQLLMSEQEESHLSHILASGFPLVYEMYSTIMACEI